MSKKMIQTTLFSDYSKKQRYTLAKHMAKLEKQSDLSYSFAFVRSSVFSSMLEGSSIDLNNYLFNKENKYIDRNMQQIDDLVKAYKYAKGHVRSEEHTSELQSRPHLVCRLLLEKKKK